MGLIHVPNSGIGDYLIVGIPALLGHSRCPALSNGSRRWLTVSGENPACDGRWALLRHHAAHSRLTRIIDRSDTPFAGKIEMTIKRYCKFPDLLREAK